MDASAKRVATVSTRSLRLLVCSIRTVHNGRRRVKVGGQLAASSLFEGIQFHLAEGGEKHGWRDKVGGQRVERSLFKKVKTPGETLRHF